VQVSQSEQGSCSEWDYAFNLPSLSGGNIYIAARKRWRVHRDNTDVIQRRSRPSDIVRENDGEAGEESLRFRKSEVSPEIERELELDGDHDLDGQGRRDG
jgi:hypothetical protein